MDWPTYIYIVSFSLTVQNPRSFNIKANKLLNGLAAIGVDLYTPQALFKMLPPDDSSFASSGLSRKDGNNSQYQNHLAVGTEPSVDEPWPYYGWGTPDEDKQKVVGLEESLEYIAQILEEQATSQQMS
jgi:hypothetical protein